MRPIKFRAWSEKRKEMSAGMPLPMLAGFLTARYPNLDDEIYLQFTGLLDKNGKEIYEGDILRINNLFKLWKLLDSGIVEVKWIGSGFYPLCNDLTQSEKAEVIGNIHENPELLK